MPPKRGNGINSNSFAAIKKSGINTRKQLPLTGTISIDKNGKFALLKIEYPAELSPLNIRGIAYVPKAEMHVTLIGSGHKFVDLIETKKSLEGKEAKVEAFRLLTKAAEGLRFSINLSGKYQLVEREYQTEDSTSPEVRRSIIEEVIIEPESLEAFYNHIEKELGTKIARVPAHITLWISGNPTGIGLISQDELATYGKKTSRKENAAIRLANDGPAQAALNQIITQPQKT